MADPVDHARLTALIVEQRQVETALEAARKDVLLWVRRGRLAKQGERPDLVAVARTAAEEAKGRFLAAQARLDAIRSEKESVRKGVRTRAEDTGSVERAEVLVEQFRMQGFAPEEQETNELAQRMEAELKLGEMKGEPVSTGSVQPGQPSEHAPGQPAEAAPQPPAEDVSVTDEEIAELERALAEAREAKPAEPAPSTSSDSPSGPDEGTK